MPSVRPSQEQLHEVLGAEPDRAGGDAVVGAIDDATARLADAVDTIVAEIRRHRVAPPRLASSA